MRKDPIVEEGRRAGDLLARRYGYDLHRLCEHFRSTEREFEGRVYRIEPAKKRKKPVQRSERGGRESR
jgi:hypothetical protein